MTTDQQGQTEASIDGRREPLAGADRWTDQGSDGTDRVDTPREARVDGDLLDV
jgi:hypothetical protein